VYLHRADNESGSVSSRQRYINRLVMISQSGCAMPRSALFLCQ
jgi:hypothetical protein